MTEQPNFGELLERLARHRDLDLVGPSPTALVTEAELQALRAGMPPGPDLLRRLAPALDLHTADLFAIAGLPVPYDLAPVDPNAGPRIGQLARFAALLPAEQIQELRQHARSLPQREGTQQAATPPDYERYAPSPGAMVVRMLRNRNLSWSVSATILLELGGVGPLAASTVGGVGHGRVALSPHLLAGFAAALAIPADYLAAVTEVDLVQIPPANPAVTDAAELIWDVRRLTTDQVRQVCDMAERMRAVVDDDVWSRGSAADPVMGR